MSQGVLVLNRNFYAIQVTPLRRALSLVYLDHAFVVDEEYRTYDFENWVDLSQEIAHHPAGFIHTPTLKIAIPEVIALRAFDKVPLREVTFSRRNIYEHYGYRCCYCGKRYPTQELNLDHIIPRSRGGRTDWMNVVTSCVRCNLKKGDRLPPEAGMRMVIAPSRPHGQARAALIFRAPFPVRRSWQRFVDNLYWNAELDQE